MSNHTRSLGQGTRDRVASVDFSNVGWRTWIHFCLWVRLVFRLIIDDLSKEEQLIIKLMLGWARAVINDEVHD